MPTSTLPIRLVPIFPDSRLGADILRRGGRIFAVRHTGSPADGDLIVAAAEAGGERQVLVPRGLGRPLLARRHGPASPASSTSPQGAQSWQAEGTGEACSSRRWFAVGGLAARIRRVALPRGPVQALPRGRRPDGSAGPWLAVRVVAPEWAAACRLDASLARGPVAVVDRFVRAVSPEAESYGVIVGMSTGLARRRCPHLRIVPAAPRAEGGNALARSPGSAVVADVQGVLQAEVGDVQSVGKALLVRLPDGGPGELLGMAERVMVRLWQQAGAHVRVAICAHAPTAVEVSRVLDGDALAFIPGTASAVWRRRNAHSRSQCSARRWAGTELVDVDGVVGLARSLVSRSAGPGELRVTTAGGLERVAVGAGPVAPQVEAILRQSAHRLGGVRELTWRPLAVHTSEQLPLLPKQQAAR